ncbi:MAG: rhamnan synthesis F family protein [Pseudomonadota bacterium]
MFGSRQKQEEANRTEEARLLFDAAWYRAAYRDVAELGIDPFTHFIEAGAFEGRDPSPLFDTDYYREANPDIADYDRPLIFHFLAHGGNEGRQCHPLFNAQFYLDQNQDVRDSGMNPYLHYLSSGGQEGRETGTLFDSAYYLKTNPDIVEQGLNPLQHFLLAGHREGRDPNQLFSIAWYLTKNPDVAEAGLNPAIHYNRTGGPEGRTCHPLFDSAYYQALYPDVFDSGLSPLDHYLHIGRGEDRRPHPLFDPQYYRRAVADGGHGSIIENDPLTHYIVAGGPARIDPHPLFNSDHYLAQVADPQSDIVPLIHYAMLDSTVDLSPSLYFDPAFYRDQRGPYRHEGRSLLADYIVDGAAAHINPHPLFQSWWYAQHHMAMGDHTTSPLAHFAEEGAPTGHSPNLYFLCDWYQAQNPDVTASGQAPFEAYITHIRALIRDLHAGTPHDRRIRPNPWFDAGWYLAENPDVLHAGDDPLGHYMTTGYREGRRPSPDFDGDWYRQTYTEVGDDDPLAHYLECGAKRGYAPNPAFGEQLNAATGDPDVSVKFSKKGKPKIDPRQHQLLAASSLFDADWYREKYLIPAGSDMDPVDHYLTFGANLGYNPSERFNTKAYRSLNHDLRSAAINPLLHYIQHGRFEGRHATKETRDNEVSSFRFSPPEYGPVTDILNFDSDVAAPENLSETICLHLHLFHTDMADEFCAMINFLTVPFTLVVSVQPDEDIDHWTDYFADQITHADRVIVKTCPNQGRDVQPWLVAFADEIAAHDLFCHIHTKKSGYNKFQRSWRRYLAHTLFGEKTIVNQILSLFANDRDVGLVFPAYFYILRNQPNYGKNFDAYERLYAMLFGDVPDEACPDYPAGSFFWARTATLEPLFNLQLTVDDFDVEDGQVDGTVAHALERILGALPAVTGHTKRCIAVDVPFDLVRYIHPARVETLNPSLILPASFEVTRETKPTPRLTEKRIAVYSSITGGYENLVRPLTIDPQIDYYLFTDQPARYAPDWATVIETPFISHKPVRTARYAKTHPHFWFADYDYAIWMDANVLPVQSLLPYVDRLEGTGYEAAFIQHPLRYNCMEEGGELIKFNLDDQSVIEEQLIRYGRYADIFGEELIETNFFICRPQLATTKTFFTFWWSELNRYSHRDQLSINYAILRSGLKWLPIFDDNQSLRDHPDFFLLEHEMANRDQFIEKIRSQLESNAQPVREAS